MVTRIVLSSHDSVGLGHVRRNLAIAHALTRSLPALTQQPVTGLLVTGQASATSFPAPDGWDWLVLPSVTVNENGYVPRRLSAGIDRLAAIRGGAVDAALRAFRPDLVIVDRHPFGVHRELATALRSLRARDDCRVVLGLRDVLDRPAAAEAEWRALGGAAAVRAHYDALWVYGDPSVHDLTVSGELPRGLRDLASFTGYLAHGRPVTAPPAVGQPFVLTTVGGGADGAGLARSAAHATPPAGHHHVIVTGPQMPGAKVAAIEDAAGSRTSVLRSVPDVLSLIRDASAVVSMGGYNSVAEIMSTSTPAMIVPRVRRRQEQAIRAAALARVHAVDTLLPDRATPEALSAFFAARAGTSVSRAAVDLDGLHAVGALAASLLSGARHAEREHAHAV